MKKYTNIILLAVGIIILICNIVFISSTMSYLSKYNDNPKDVYDEYYYNDDDYLIDGGRN
ncbi:MAG: hypothetical protein J6X01_06535 [Bacteroidales bacterium]|jgi:hypothetical protein|nr:hypothetical protein [Bacteroidales bacterium]